MTKVYNKLVRDRIPAIIAESGLTPQTRVLDEEEYAEKLVQKLQEEVTEYLQDNNSEELADILEIIYALATLHNCSPDQLENLRKEKAEKRGGFEEKVFLIEVN